MIVIMDVAVKAGQYALAGKFAMEMKLSLDAAVQPLKANDVEDGRRRRNTVIVIVLMMSVGLLGSHVLRLKRWPRLIHLC